MKMAKDAIGRIAMALGIALAVVSTGCVWYADDGGDYYEGDVVEPGPDIFIFGGGYDRDRHEHEYGRRGSESRAAAHPERRAAPHENHAPVRSGGGEHGGKR